MEDFAGTAAVATPAPAGVEFTGRRGTLFRIVLKNVLLNIVTIGIFRFWGKTRVRRYFWSNIVIGGEPLEYTGRGLELFIGFLIVLAVLFPLSLVQSGIALLISPESFFTEGALNLGFFLIFLFLLQFALFRMWRYRLTRTCWRSIRFRLEGSALRYAGRAFLWLLAQAATLGIATPWARVDLMRYKLRRVNYGDSAFGFEGNGRALLVPWLITWLPPALLVIVGLVTSGDELIHYLASPPQETPAPPTALPIVFALAPIPFLLFGLLFIWYRVREFRYFVGCLRFGEATFRSEARLGRILPGFLLAAGAFVLLGLIVLLAGVGLAFLVGHDSESAMAVAAFVPLVLFLILLLSSPLVTYPLVVFPIVRHVWTSLTVSNPEAFNRAVQATEEGPKFGEGLADAFDVGAF